MLVRREKWTVPQLTGVYGMVRVPRNLIVLCYPQEVYSPDQKSLKSPAILYLAHDRNGQWRQQDTNWRHKKIDCDEKKMRCHKMLHFCCTTVQFLSIFFDFSSTAIKISLFLSCSKRILNLVVLDSSFKIEKFLREMANSFSDLKSLTAKSFSPCQLHKFSVQFSLCSQILGYFDCSYLPWILCALWSAFGLPRLTSFTLSTRSVQDKTPEGVLSQCWCSLTLTHTTSMGIWHGADATKSWSSVESLSCSCRISLWIRSSCDSGGWAARIIRFSSLVFSTVSITRIQQDNSSLAIRNHSFRLQIEGRLTFRDISPGIIRTKRVNLLHRP